MKVITSIDDEGNGYNEVHYSPSKGVFNDDGEYLDESDEEAYEDYGYDKSDINAVCIN